MKSKTPFSPAASNFVASMTRTATESSASTRETLLRPLQGPDNEAGSNDAGNLDRLLEASHTLGLLWEALEEATEYRNPGAVQELASDMDKIHQRIATALGKDRILDNSRLFESYLAATGRHILDEADAVCGIGRQLHSVWVNPEMKRVQACLISVLYVPQGKALPCAQIDPAVRKRVEDLLVRLGDVPELQVRLHPTLITPSQLYGLTMHEIGGLSQGQVPACWKKATSFDVRDKLGSDSISGFKQENARALVLFVEMPKAHLDRFEDAFITSEEAAESWGELANVLMPPESNATLMRPADYFETTDRMKELNLMVGLLDAVHRTPKALLKRVKSISVSIHHEPDVESDIREIRIALLAKNQKVLSAIRCKPQHPVHLDVVHHSTILAMAIPGFDILPPTEESSNFSGMLWNGDAWVEYPKVDEEPILTLTF